ncbi:similar to Saccharomyces cerevisiae YJR033C RAV1 Subunit of the RAVE complex (Rav1p, Rav2p, Skp1p), which promotes assembly of the V-ATPase holoenzyme [Maudiozyma saulgeensis]|uniref:Similar to Saccharomyces cerevisiae YJR033C RAV1 Subunit of the RAVE complex (Rav1p, Rav2p, Skp1p), which promotes assembly of the V-ATPase holoenzyme n=1 Tax=Maudiozyma saulgeensis TaxID=1789683 RepID=A0A1X7R1M3_9SACH|nr:similar to Saccharomyces cerevisiae YJR033C RAV1 Subunit of the RAVE complex (Rav1p, Rav2p, Skp1p), which promotes assembly of the V-ATPase holoenzyme [Kazachstania saulgeensis]
MSLSYLPGRPNETPQTMCQATWQKHTIFAYCSGNNVIIMTNDFSRLQTLYLEQDCNAVDINLNNGFIAIGYGNRVGIYKPLYQVMKDPKWISCCEIFHDPSIVNSVRWGLDNELVVGSEFLSFWKIKDNFGEYEPILLWNKRQPKPVYSVTISQDSQLIASFSKYDITVKLWKRISISGEQDIFNLTLLPHPDYVTAIRWKSSRTNHRSQVLYTLCSDKKLRIWTCYEIASGRKTVQNWGSLQLGNQERFCIIVDNWILKNVLPPTGNELEYFNSNSPDLAITVTNSGDYTVHALENLSTDPPKPLLLKTLFSGELSRSFFPKNPSFLYFAEIQPYNDQSPEISLMAHSLGGMIRHATVNLPNLLAQKQNQTNEFVLHHVLAGHNKSIQELVRSSDGEALLTQSRFSENSIWTPQRISKDEMTLFLKNVVHTEAPIRLAVLHERGNLLICLLENLKLQAWDCPRNENPNFKTAVLKSEYIVPSPPDGIKPLLMLNTPELVHNHERHFVAIVYSDGSTCSYEVSLVRGIAPFRSESLDLNGQSSIYKISKIDPVHPTFICNRPLISLATENGLVTEYKATVDYENKVVEWSKWKEVVTGVKNPLFISGSSTGKLCVVSEDGKIVSFWDVDGGVLEYEEIFTEQIQDIDWTSTAFEQSIMSIGFAGYALLYTQLRYDYTNNSPSYLPIEKIDITAHTAHKIGDSVWLKDATFVVASGNQLYIKDKSLDLNDPFTHKSIGSRTILSNDILHLNSVLNGPLPVYHPQFLIQAIYANKIELVKEILLRLFLKLRDIDLNSKDITVNLPSDLDLDSQKFFIKRDKDYPVEIFPDPYPIFNDLVASGLSQQLIKMVLPYITRHQQVTLMTVVEAAKDIMKHNEVIDINGVRFLLGVKLFMSHRPQQTHLVMRDVSWALHSDNKELLLSQLDWNTTSWERACEYKIALWVKGPDLVNKMEEIAKYEFNKTEIKDPSLCSIFYLALKKKQVILALWKMSYGNPEQQKMIKFLNNDFNEPRWKTAALKNAFVLLSKHRYLDAATFFLLAGALKDCANVLYKQLNDIDLAIGVCRVYEGDNGPVLGDFLTSKVLPKAIQENDRWMSSYVYWKLRKQDISIKALVTPPIELENNSQLVKHDALVNKSFLVEDPALLHLYIVLRERNIKYFTASLEMGTQNEYKLILRVVDILNRMGCDYLSASLVREWNFIKRPKYIKNKPEFFGNTPSTSETLSTNKTIVEPVTTERVRPSLFDMFDKQTSSSDSPKIENDSKVSGRNILDSFNTPVSSKPKSILDSFVSSPQQKSMLADFMTPSPVAESSQNTLSSMSDSFTTQSETKLSRNGTATTPSNNHTPIASQKPRSLLDDFM